MNGIFKLALNDKVVRSGIAVSFSVIILELIIIAIFYLSLPPLMPIFNQLPWGASRLGPKIAFLIPTTLALLFFVGNSFLITILHEKTPLLSRILSITTLLIAILSIIFVARTLQLII